MNGWGDLGMQSLLVTGKTEQLLELYEHARRLEHVQVLIDSANGQAELTARLGEKAEQIKLLLDRKQEYETMLNSTHDAIIGVNQQGIITLFNSAAERLIGKQASQMLGKPAEEVIDNTRLHIVLQTGESELNQEQMLPNGTRIVTNRVPVRSQTGEILGAVAIFRDITDIMALVEEVTDLKELKSMLQAIILSSDEAISVVDANGIGLLINPAYTRLTGLSPEEVIGKPADVDISEGESMHMRVLQTKKPVRGTPMKIGPKRKDVIVNVAPVMVDGVVRGSVGVIHDVTEFKTLTEELEKARRIIRKLEAKYTFAEIIGESESMRIAVEQAKTAASTRATVLLRGESGTGKEVFAHAIHNESDRKYNQFIRVNCAAIPEALLESELFGYEAGAFTGALRGGRKGLFEEASGGTIFLDEIGDLPQTMQVKLLRVLQEKEITRVGGSKEIPVDVRIIAATHVNLESAILKGGFREDLYYRLNVVPIHIPPLRQRREDISLLVRYLLRKFNAEYGRNVEEIDERALRCLQEYQWPGNVRELENVLGRAMINMRYNESVILPEHLPQLTQPVSLGWEEQTRNVSGGKDQQKQNAYQQEIQIRSEATLKHAMEEAEKHYILKKLHECQGNRTKTARQLGISLRSLYYKLEKYGVVEPEEQS